MVYCQYSGIYCSVQFQIIHDRSYIRSSFSEMYFHMEPLIALPFQYYSMMPCTVELVTRDGKYSRKGSHHRVTPLFFKFFPRNDILPMDRYIKSMTMTATMIKLYT